MVPRIGIGVAISKMAARRRGTMRERGMVSVNHNAPVHGRFLRSAWSGVSVGTLVTAICSTVLMGSPADAQNLAPQGAVLRSQDATSTDTAPPPAKGAPSVGAPSSQNTQEIIVTARRRNERIQDVPLAITAFTEKALAQKAITDGYDLQRAAPSLVASTSGNRSDGLTYSMRGQSNTYGSGGASVIVYFADVPQDAGYAGAPFFDLANVQVLSGPQGTLFGQSSTGGAVLFTPRRPTDSFGGYITGGLGNLNFRKIEGALNIPVTGTLAVRVAGNIIRRDGFTHDNTYNIDEDGEHEENWRVGVQWKPGSLFDDYLVADGRHVHVNGTAYSLYQVFGPGLILPDGSFTQALAEQQARGPRAIANSPDAPQPSNRVQNWGLSNTASFHFGAVTLKDIFGYRKTIGEPGNTQDGDGTPLPILTVYPAAPPPAIIPPGFENTPESAYTISNEVQLLGTAFGGKLNWIVGGFYSHHNSGKQQNNFGVTSPVYNFLCTAPAPGAPCPDPSPPFTPADPPASTSFTGGSIYTNPNTRTSKAVFAQGTYDLSSLIDGLKFTAGYRYSMDKNTTGSGYDIFSGVPAFLLPLASPYSSYKSHGSSYNLSLYYKLTNKIMIYFDQRRGYKAGQPAANLYPGDVGHYVSLPIKPETIMDYELGAKTGWSSGALSGRLDGDVYYSDYRNIQRQIASAYTSAPIGLNVPKARIIGLELMGNVQYESFSVDATYSYTDAKYVKFTNPFLGPEQMPDATNDPFGFVPKQKVNVSAHYDLDLGDAAGHIGYTIGYSWQAKFYYTEQSFNFPNAIVPSHSLVNARIDWSDFLGSNMTASIFGDNITNKTYIENGNLDAGEVGRAFYGAPRTYGIELSYHF